MRDDLMIIANYRYSTKDCEEFKRLNDSLKIKNITAEEKQTE